MRFIYKIFAFIALSFFVSSGAMAARSSVPMELFHDEPIPSFSSGKITQANINDAFVRAGLKDNWIVTKNSDGTLNAHLSIRQHELDLTIKFHDGKYDIDYKNSVNLGYAPNPSNAEQPMIHPNVNRWIRNLIVEINKQFASL